MPKLDPSTSPNDIEQRSFDIIDSEVTRPENYDDNMWQVARRMIHTSGDVGIIKDIMLTHDAITSGIEALRKSCTIFTDTEMARCGMVSRRLNPLGVKTQCILSRQDVSDFAKTHNCTRARAGMLQIESQLSGNIIAIGNAPTALLALLELLKNGSQAPALIIGMPVGFVNAAESKELLVQSPYLHLSLRGRKGGSPLVASVVNALAIIANQAK